MNYTDKDLVSAWLVEIEQARKREQQYRERGKRIIDLYSSKIPEMTPFNILFSNTETLSPALYSASPSPRVERRYKDDDPLGLAAAVAAERMLSFQLDTNIDGYETFDEVIGAAVLDGLLPGRGVSCVKYDATFSKLNPVIPSGEKNDEDGPLSSSNEPPAEYADKEQVCLETKVWDRVLFGYAKKWSSVPWIAYEEYVDREEATRLFGADIANAMRFSSDGEKNDEYGSKNDSNETYGLHKTACIYQIWDKRGGKKIRYISESYPDGFLAVLDDPLQLTGFYNCPRPLQFVETAHTTIPVAMYDVYETQAIELNRLSMRIRHITEAIKARGIYDGELGGDLENLMEADDNKLVPAERSSSLAAEKGLDNAIWFMPIDKLVAVLQQLFQAREMCKQVIFDLTGIADIMRGASKASETLGAQQIKTSWGTLRIRNKQKEVQRYVRDLMRIMVEISASRFDEQTWAKMTGLPYLTSPQVQQLQAQLQAMQMQQVQQIRMQPDGSMQPPMPNPEMQAIQQALQQPQWSQVIGVLRDDLQRAYRIDIETNSTIEPEASDDQRDILALMTAIGQVMNGLAPMVAQGVLPFEVAKTLLLAVSRRFRFGKDIESMIQSMQAPVQQQQGDAKAQADQQIAQAQQEAEAQKAKDQMELSMKTMQAEKDLLEQRVDLELKEIQLKAERDHFEMQKEADESDAAVDGVASDGTAPTRKSAVLEQFMQQQAAMMQMLASAISTPKVKRAIRGPDGKIQSVIEETPNKPAPLSMPTSMAADGKQGSPNSQLLNQFMAHQTQMMNTLASTINSPKVQRAVRGPDGKIQSVIQES